jgi:TonB-dependent receptor
MLDLPLWRDQLRAVGGVRYEDDDIHLDVFDELTAQFDTIKKHNQDWLPGVNLVYSPLEDMNFRLGWSETVSRPDFRELSPAEFPAQRGERAKVGNPLLVQASITSYDARWEWFFSPNELVSASFFYKELDMPIEQIVIQRASDQANSFANAESGHVLGVEFEGRKDLGFLWYPLHNLSLVSNVTWAQSEVTAPRTSTLEVQTNTKRKLQGQPDLIVNASIEYTHPDWGTARLLYLTADDQIASIGTFGLPDIIETRRDQLDAVFIMPLDRFGIPLRAKLSLSNLLNDPFEYSQGGETQERYTTGVSVGFSLTYSR